jgi:RNA polymerase sigma-70 factor (ECF subfamily)
MTDSQTNLQADLQNKTDEELTQLAIQKVSGAFDELINRWEKPILRYCLRLLNYNQMEAEDATSETFLKAWKNLASYKKEFKFSSWLYRIAHNSAVNIIRSNSKFFSIDLQDFWYIPAPQKQESKLTTEELESVLSKLKETDKNLLVLFHLEEKSLREISDILKLSENTIAVKLKRARERARKFLSPTINFKN